MRHRVAFGTLPPTPAAVPGHKQENVTGALSLSPPLGAPVIVLRPRAAADPFGAELAGLPTLSACDVGILRGLFREPGGD